MEKNIRQIRFGGGIDQISRCWAVLAHPHIKRAVAHEGKATLGEVKLHGGDAQIEHDPVEILGIGVHFGEHAFLQGNLVAKARNPWRGHGEGERVAVDPGDVICPCGEKALGVAPSPERAIKPMARNRGDGRQERAQQDRDMRRVGGCGSST